ncbi:MAG TPA: hypothetical protein VLM85_21385 [Polyangiaceae bacterium]|nr:hypothetical protein [Polyangiaceae bacterium]
MRTPLASPEGERLLVEASRFALRYTCDDCAHFDEQLAACGHGYPTTPHRAARLPQAGEIVFCKEFELG